MALLILFALVVISAVFVVVLSRNLAMTTRGREVSSAQQLAQQGMDYADQMLTTSPLGADWRPPAPPAKHKVQSSYASGDAYDLRGNLIHNAVWRPVVLPPPAPTHPDPAQPNLDLDLDYPVYYQQNEIGAGLDPQAVYDKPASDSTRTLLGYVDGFAKYPDPREVPAGAVGEGYFLIKVEYDPGAGQPPSKYVRISSVGESLRDPTLLRRLVAYKPIGISEYVRFVTNEDRSSRDTDWGIPPWIDYNNNGTNDEQYTEGTPPAVTPNSIYNAADRSAISDLYGPVRFQTNVFFRGASRFYLWPVNTLRYRNDQVEIAGTLDYSTVDVDKSVDPWKGMGTIVDFYNMSAGSTRVPAYNISDSPNSPPEKPAAFAYVDSEGDVIFKRKVPRINPPNIFAKDPATQVERYEALTKRSGPWLVVDGNERNTGMFAYWQDDDPITSNFARHFADGCSVDNPADVQFSHNLESLRDNFLRPGTALVPGQYWNAAAVYTPPAVTIELKPGKLDATAQYQAPPSWNPLDPLFDPAKYADYPKIVITRNDGQQFKAAVWDSVTSAYLTQDVGTTLERPYPRNGVIYCAGNARIYGSLPQRNREADRSNAGGAAYPIENLTVVSGGTIYIDGSLLTPQAAAPSLAFENRSYIGLLANDMVALNPTLSGRTGGSGASAIVVNGDVSVEANATGSQEGHYEIRPGGSYVIRSDVVGQLSDPTTLTVTHCGADPGPTAINIVINGQYFDFDSATAGLQNRYVFASFPAVREDDPVRSNHLSPDFETKSWDITAYLNRNDGDVNYITIQLDPSSSTPYWLWSFKLTGQIGIGGGPSGGGGVLAYAQRGSWFVIPGRYAGDPANPLMRDAEAVNHLRYNTPIYFKGAIAESHSADSPAVAEWVKKWSYPYWQARGTWESGLPPAATDKPYWGTVRYEFEDDLINNRRGGLPILPALPVSPDLIYEGEG